MRPAPLVASAETKPRRIRSISERRQPGLDHMGAEAPDDRPLARRASSTAVDHRAKILAGQQARQRRR